MIKPFSFRFRVRALDQGAYVRVIRLEGGEATGNPDSFRAITACEHPVRECP
jgi:hypothetical protein